MLNNTLNHIQASITSECTISNFSCEDTFVLNDVLRTESTNDSSCHNYTSQISSSIASSANGSEKLTLHLTKACSSHKQCFVCKSKASYAKLISIKSDASFDILAKKNIFVVKGSRCCNYHLDEKGFLTKEALTNLQAITGNVDFDKEAIQELIDAFQNSKSTNQFFSQYSSSNPIEENSLSLIGFTKEEFLFLYEYLEEMKDTKQRTKQQALFIYLFWLRNGLSMEKIGYLFNLTFQDVSRYCFQIRDAFKEFVDDFLGAKRMPREQWLTHNTTIAKDLFCENDFQLILIADGTYCYCQKSANNYFQRVTYSGQKKRHLVKPFVICTCDGTIVDIYGFYSATTNDATIMEDILLEDTDLREIFQENDILIADRGFRDCQKSIKEKYKINVMLPSCN